MTQKKKKKRPEKPIGEIMDSFTKKSEWTQEVLTIPIGASEVGAINEVSRFVNELHSKGWREIYTSGRIIFRGTIIETDERFEARKKRARIAILASRKAKSIRSKQRKLQFESDFKLYKKLRKKFEGGGHDGKERGKEKTNTGETEGDSS